MSAKSGARGIWPKRALLLTGTALASLVVLFYWWSWSSDGTAVDPRWNNDLHEIYGDGDVKWDARDANGSFLADRIIARYLEETARGTKMEDVHWNVHEDWELTPTHKVMLFIRCLLGQFSEPLPRKAAFVSLSDWRHFGN